MEGIVKLITDFCDIDALDEPVHRHINPIVDVVCTGVLMSIFNFTIIYQIPKTHARIK